MAAEPELTVTKCTAQVLVSLDDDGTPLTLHGERMVEIAPGQWADPLVAMALEYFEKVKFDGTAKRPGHDGVGRDFRGRRGDEG